MLQYGTKIRLWIYPELLIFSPHTLWSAWLFYTCKQKGKQMDEQFMRKKAVLPLITSMALPMVLSMLVNALYNIVDSYFVARISENAMTALSLVYPLQNLVNAIAIGFGVGSSAVIALYLGAGKQKRADQAATQALYDCCNEEQPNGTGQAVLAGLKAQGYGAGAVESRVPFSSARKWSAVRKSGETWYMGAPEVIISALEGDYSSVLLQVNEYANDGNRVLLVARSTAPLSEGSCHQR